MCICTCNMHIYICVICVYRYLYTCVCMYIYIYVYVRAQKTSGSCWVADGPSALHELWRFVRPTGTGRRESADPRRDCASNVLEPALATHLGETLPCWKGITAALGIFD